MAPGFEPMDADARLPRIEVPVQAIQGEDDDYGSELQLGIIAGKVGGYCETRLVPDYGPAPTFSSRPTCWARSPGSWRRWR